jgi:hypothetical protein
MSIPLQNNFMKVNITKSVLSKRKEPEEPLLLIAAESAPKSSNSSSTGFDTILSSKRNRSHIAQDGVSNDAEDTQERKSHDPVVGEINPTMILTEPPPSIPKEFLCVPPVKTNLPPVKIHCKTDDDDFELANLVEDGGPD